MEIPNWGQSPFFAFLDFLNLTKMDSDPNKIRVRPVGLLATFYFLVATIIVASMFIFFTPPTGEPQRYVQAPAE